MDGEARSLVSARKASRMKDEKDVNEPQKPVDSPINSGIVFFTLPWLVRAFWTTCAEEESGLDRRKDQSLEFVPHSCRKRRRSSARKPMNSEPPTLAQRTTEVDGA